MVLGRDISSVARVMCLPDPLAAARFLQTVRSQVVNSYGCNAIVAVGGPSQQPEGAEGVVPVGVVWFLYLCITRADD